MYCINFGSSFYQFFSDYFWEILGFKAIHIFLGCSEIHVMFSMSYIKMQYGAFILIFIFLK